MTFAPHLATLFRSMGQPATYTPPTGAPVSLKVMRATLPLIFGNIEVPAEGLALDVLRSDCTPEVGGSMTIGGSAHIVDAVLPFPVSGIKIADPEGLKWRVLCGWGSPVVYRMTTGTGATQNPPTGSGFTVAASASAGATAVSVKALLTTGRLLAGDKLTIGTATYTVTAPVTAATNTFVSIPLDRPLEASVAAGTAVTFSWACDKPLRAAVTGYEASELLGGLQVGDQRLVIPHASLVAAGITDEPNATHAVTVGARAWKVKTAVAARQAGQPVVWELTVGT